MANFAMKLGITPNMATLLGFSVSIVAAGLIFLYSMWSYILILSAGLMLLAGYFDALDGAIARNSHRITAFGGFLDSVLDRYADAIIISIIILSGLCVNWIGLIALFGSLLVSYTRARAEAAGGQKMAVGLFERGERMLLIMGVLILQGIPQLAYTANMQWGYVGIGIIILAIATHITAIQRILYARKLLPEIENEIRERAIQEIGEPNSAELKKSDEIPAATDKIAQKSEKIST